MTETAPDILLLRREVALRRRELELRSDNEIYFFQPHTKQNAFFGAANFRRRYARTGNRFGKSEMGAAEDVAFALGFRPWVAEGNPLRTLGIPPRPTKGLIVTTDWDKSTEIFTSQEAGPNRGKLFKYIPKDALVECTKNHSGAIDRIVVKHISGGHSVIHLDTVKSYKQNPLGQESSAWDWVHIDEPCPEGMWKAIARGLVDRNGSAWFTCTPLTEPWIDQKFIPDSENLSRDLDTIVSSNDHWMMTGSMYDNPHNTHEAIALFLSELTEDERECRISGIPAAYSGLVYKEFKWDEHTHKDPPKGWTSWSTPPKDHCLRYSIDYHPRKPNAVLFIATSPTDIHYVYAELWTPSLADDFIEEIRSICLVPTVQATIDPLASTPNKVTGITYMQEMQNAGLDLIPATKDPSNGIIKVRSLLRARTKDGVPVIYFNPALKRTIFEISRGFQWNADTNEPLKKDDDMMECLYRLVLNGLYYLEPTTSSDYSPILERDSFDGVIDASELFRPFDDSEAKAKRFAERYR